MSSKSGASDPVLIEADRIKGTKIKPMIIFFTTTPN
ncbi:MAG: hypothetical protein Ct9H90mP4_03720 [Gammaproteobacteria bacterium]|nr:MAG: hypothetical protein Ct9H90mP4_03720 [Gammaproteobacteria bacterium]|tara:strand:- start:605 stop:712 length:108 start_codon:yes stop_codon:yes gene_type:complete